MDATVRPGKPGRPKKPRNRGRRVEFWLPLDICEPMRARAESQGLCLSAWVRMVALKEFRRKAA